MNEDHVVDGLLAARERATTLALPARLDLDTAWRLSIATEARRRAAGEQTRGWKIGFTNRGIWPRYGVDRPIWARVWDSTLTLLDGSEATVSLAGLVQPRIEPEIVFGFARVPPPGADEAALVPCLAWVAHGVEIVHTHLPEGWRFTSAAEPVADFGLHGRLVVGPRQPLAGWHDAPAALAALGLELRREGAAVDRGIGANVLGGPLHALREWLAALAAQGRGVEAGELVTTGTLTDAWPVEAGQRWSTHPDDPRLPGLRVRFVA